jgi:hypothetical protein
MMVGATSRRGDFVNVFRPITDSMQLSKERRRTRCNGSPLACTYGSGEVGGGDFKTFVKAVAAAARV